MPPEPDPLHAHLLTDPVARAALIEGRLLGAWMCRDGEAWRGGRPDAPWTDATPPLPGPTAALEVGDTLERVDDEGHLSRLHRTEAGHIAVHLSAPTPAADPDLEALTKALSHDLSQPLRTLSGFTAILADGGSRVASEERLLTGIQDAADRLHDDLSRCMHFLRASRAAGPQTRVDPTPVLHACVRDVEGVAVDLDASPLPACWCQEDALRDILYASLRFVRGPEGGPPCTIQIAGRRAGVWAELRLSSERAWTEPVRRGAFSVLARHPPGLETAARARRRARGEGGELALLDDAPQVGLALRLLAAP